MTSPTKALKGGALNAAISNAIVGLLRENVGKGPNKARTIHSDKIVLCVLENNMTKAEQTLAARGKKDYVLGIRHAFQETMQPELTDAVESLTGRKVVAFMSANHVNPDLAAEVFVLDQPVNGVVLDQPVNGEVAGNDSNSSDVAELTAASPGSPDGQVTSSSPDGQV